MSAKFLFRQQIKSQLRLLQPTEIAHQSLLLAQRLVELEEWKAAQTLSIYLHMPNGEVHTDAILENAFFPPAGVPPKNVLVPYIDGQNMEMLPFSIEDYRAMVRLRSSDRDASVMKEGSLYLDKWGIPSITPNSLEGRRKLLSQMHKTAAFSSSSLIDLVLVPGVAFDMEGHRLGHGKGFYDRYLSSMTQDAHRIWKVGLALEEQLFEAIPHEKSDVLMDAIVTPKKVLIFQQREPLKTIQMSQSM